MRLKMNVWLMTNLINSIISHIAKHNLNYVKDRMVLLLNIPSLPRVVHFPDVTPYNNLTISYTRQI
jgi:hypothetical protein